MRLIDKLAAMNAEFKPRPHQQEVIDAISKNRKAIIAHGTGTGKTVSSIASFERLRNEGKASKALIVVPSGLRQNYADNIKQFTNSSYNIYGAKGEKGKSYIDQPSKADYDIISYDLFRKDPEGIKARTGADTLIVDEVHRARTDTSQTYKTLAEQAGKYNNVLTLTGSIVNNSPSDVSPLLDATFGGENNPFGGRSGFERSFIKKIRKRTGGLFPKTETKKVLVNQGKLADIMRGKILYKSHGDVADQMPPKEEEVVKVPMSKKQKELYKYTLDQLDPIIRRKIMRNIPVDQREMSGIFTKMMQARKVMTDPAQLDEPLQEQNPYEYSPKIRRAIDDLTAHLDESPKNKAVVYGNLVRAQLNAYSKALESKNIPYSTFYGSGNEGNKPAERQQSLNDYMAGKKRVILLSGAGAEGLNLRGSTMMQLLEGHYNPERVQQAEARVVRMGDKPEKPIAIKKYVSYMEPSFLNKALGTRGTTSADEYIYSVAKRKDELNQQLRDVLEMKKKKGLLERMGISK